MIVVSNTSDNWLADRERTIVLSIDFEYNGQSQYLLWSASQNASALFPAADLTIVEATLSRCWIFFHLKENGRLLESKAWLAPNLEDRHHVSGHEANQIFHLEMELILRECSKFFLSVCTSIIKHWCCFAAQHTPRTVQLILNIYERFKSWHQYVSTLDYKGSY